MEGQTLVCAHTAKGTASPPHSRQWPRVTRLLLHSPGCCDPPNPICGLPRGDQTPNDLVPRRLRARKQSTLHVDSLRTALPKRPRPRILPPDTLDLTLLIPRPQNNSFAASAASRHHFSASGSPMENQMQICIDENGAIGEGRRRNSDAFVVLATKCKLCCFL
jgi:hypothetical protein